MQEAAMHERRNFWLTVALAACLAWGLFAWVVVGAFPNVTHVPPSTMFHKLASVALALIFGVVLIYAYLIEDKLPDDLSRVTMGRYFEQDGLCFMPMVRVTEKKQSRVCEISLYYQNRYSKPCEVVCHIRPPEGSFWSHKGAMDVHFAFRCDAGAFGVVHQPVAVPPEHQGESIEVQIAAAVRWPMGHGEQLRSHRGERCGTFDVDWALAYRQSRHELCGELELRNPARVQLSLPDSVETDIERNEFLNETFSAIAREAG